jgi:hypothetical protein
VKSAGTTGASITGGNTLNATAAGTATITATIANGAAAGTDYTQDFSIAVEKEKVTGVSELHPDNPLRAWVRDGLLHVAGLTTGETLSIYNATGALVYHSVATSAEMDINLLAQGVYIIRSGDNTIKVSFNN